jgi:hypothetical protein
MIDKNFNHIFHFFLFLIIEIIATLEVILIKNIKPVIVGIT